MKTRQKIRIGIILFSFFLFPAIFYYLSPVLIIQASSKGIINGSFVIFIFMFISSLFLGRGYCGWVCPGAGCQESIFLARNKKVKKGDYLKWLIWVPWISSIVLQILSLHYLNFSINSHVRLHSMRIGIPLKMRKMCFSSGWIRRQQEPPHAWDSSSPFWGG